MCPRFQKRRGRSLSHFFSLQRQKQFLALSFFERATSASNEVLSPSLLPLLDSRSTNDSQQHCQCALQVGFGSAFCCVIVDRSSSSSCLGPHLQYDKYSYQIEWGVAQTKQAKESKPSKQHLSVSFIDRSSAVFHFTESKQVAFSSRCFLVHRCFTLDGGSIGSSSLLDRRC